MEMLFRWLNSPLVGQTAGEIARECHIAVWERVLSKTRWMDPAQARGYVRAIAPAYITREVDVVLSRRRVSNLLRPPIIAEATEQLIELVVDDVVCTQSRQREDVWSKAA